MIEERKGRRFILLEGALEAYLPVGYKGKDLEKLIELLSGEFWEQLPEKEKPELEIFVSEIKKMLQPDQATDAAIHIETEAILSAEVVVRSN